MKKNTVYYRHKIIAQKVDFEAGFLIDKIQTIDDAFKHFLQIWDMDTISVFESFYVIYVNNSSIPIGYVELSKGGIAGTVVDITLIFAAACSLCAKGMIIAHNHPSGSLKASEPDKIITNRIKEVCDIFSIILIDHLILTDSGYLSFSKEGLI